MEKSLMTRPPGSQERVQGGSHGDERMAAGGRVAVGTGRGATRTGPGSRGGRQAGGGRRRVLRTERGSWCVGG